MKNILDKTENFYWGFWFTIIIFIIPLTGQILNTQVLAFALFGWIISGFAYFLRKNPKKRFWFNFSIGLIWSILYILIGYPNLKTQFGEIKSELLWLLFSVSFIPLFFLIAIRIITTRSSKNSN